LFEFFNNLLLSQFWFYFQVWSPIFLWKCEKAKEIGFNLSYISINQIISFSSTVVAIILRMDVKKNVMSAWSAGLN